MIIFDQFQCHSARFSKRELFWKIWSSIGLARFTYFSVLMSAGPACLGNSRAVPNFSSFGFRPSADLCCPPVGHILFRWYSNSGDSRKLLCLLPTSLRTTENPLPSADLSFKKLTRHRCHPSVHQHWLHSRQRIGSVQAPAWTSQHRRETAPSPLPAALALLCHLFKILFDFSIFLPYPLQWCTHNSLEPFNGPFEWDRINVGNSKIVQSRQSALIKFNE